MNVCMECLPCLGKNALDAAKRSSSDPAVQKRILAESFRLLAGCDYKVTSPYMARKILDIALACTGHANLYDQEKRDSNALAEKLVAELGNLPEYHGENFESRLRLAVAGNILDFGIFANLDIQSALTVVKSALSRTIDLNAVRRLKEKMDASRHILYLLDNCGEAVFDRVFMEPYKDKITLGVRGQAIFNDVTEKDLPDCGLSGWDFITDGSSGYPGCVYPECSDSFKKVFEEADLVIAKGQGNFETLSDCGNPIAFLFLAKCPVVAHVLNTEMKSIQIRLKNF